MRTIIFLLTFLLLIKGNHASSPSTTGFFFPPEKILIINSYDASLSRYRSNKKELFNELGGLIQGSLSEGLKTAGYNNITVIPGITKEDTILSLIEFHHPDFTIIIDSLDAFFDQTHVEVEKVGKEKNRTAYYDLCSRVVYSLYEKFEKKPVFEVQYCEYFTSRGVSSGLLALGPDIVAKSKHARKNIQKNAEKFLKTKFLKLPTVSSY